jgi:PAS domain S-box-containing protein
MPMHQEPGNQWLNAVLTAFDQAVIGTTVQDTIVIWNHGAERLLGYSPQETIGRPRSLLSPHGESPDIGALGQELVASGGGGSRSVALRCRDRSVRPVTASLYPVFDTAGHVSGIIEIVRAGDVIEAPSSVVGTTVLGGVRRPESLHQEGGSATGDLTVARLTHELSEPITAIGNYLLGAKLLLSRGAQPDRMKLEAAIAEALTQVSRAAVIFQRLRPEEADKETH